MPTKATVTYPYDAIDTSKPIQSVYFFGKKLGGDLQNALLTCNLSMGTDQVTELEMVFSDPEFRMLRSGLFRIGVPMRFEDLYCDVASVETGVIGQNESVTVRCRSRYVRYLKNRRGKLVMRKVSPSQFVSREVKAVKAKFVIQPSTRRRQVWRDRGKNAETQEQNSSWTTFKRLADELGFILFEAAGTVYFGQPSWILNTRKSNAFRVNWNTGTEDTQTLSAPVCRKSADRGDGGTTVQFSLPLARGRHLRPGDVIRLAGVPTFEGYYLVDSVDFSLLESTQVNVEASTPTDPTKNPPTHKKSAVILARPKTSGARMLGTAPNILSNIAVEQKGSYRGGHSLTALLQYVGFGEDGLDLATAIVMAQSKANARYVDTRDTNNVWGPRVGIFGIRSLKDHSSYAGVDKLRNRLKLYGALYSARLAYLLSEQGTNWSEWDVYRNGTYKQFYRTNANYVVTNWSPPVPKESLTPESTQTKRATDFVSESLKQTESGVVYGLEATESNAFDVAELVRWASEQVGVYVPDGADNISNYCHNVGIEKALRTRGALLWKPGRLAISLGMGLAIESINSGYAIRKVSKDHASFDWQIGLTIPDLRY